MRFDWTLMTAVLLSSAAAVIDPQSQHAARRDDFARGDNDLFRRKGGGGGGGRGGGGGGGGRSGGGSSGGRGGAAGGGGGGSGSGGFRGNTGASSNFGGTSRGGSGPPRTYGGGGFYGGGAAVPYRAGLATAAGVGALLLTTSALAFWPGTWYHGAYLYPHRDEFSFYNSTTQRTERLPVVCGCAKDEVCSCDENPTALKELVGNGTYQALNQSIITVGDYQGRKTLLINGTLPNGTTADGPDGDSGSSDGFGTTSLIEAAGIWSLAACVLAALCLA